MKWCQNNYTWARVNDTLVCVGYNYDGYIHFAARFKFKKNKPEIPARVFVGPKKEKKRSWIENLMWGGDEKLWKSLP